MSDAKPPNQNSPNYHSSKVPFRTPDYQSDNWKKNDQQLSAAHVVRRISTLVDQLDLESLLQKQPDVLSRSSRSG